MVTGMSSQLHSLVNLLNWPPLGVRFAKQLLLATCLLEEADEQD